MIYQEDLWNAYVERITDNYKPKNYPHFDSRFNFKNESHQIRKILKGRDGKTLAEHAFLPFIKMVLKTPRLKYDPNRNEGDGGYALTSKKRPISFAAHKDAYIYGYVAYVLGKKYEAYIKKEGFGDCVLAYRSDLDGKCNIQFAKEVFDNVKGYIKDNGECSALALDIKSYFDNLDHDKLKLSWCKVSGYGDEQLPNDEYTVFRSLTRYSYLVRNSLLKHFGIKLHKLNKKGINWNTYFDLFDTPKGADSLREKMSYLKEKKLIVSNARKRHETGSGKVRGIPQGSSMSAVLSNIYLIEFDKYIHSLCQKNGFIYRRYCDDLIIVGPSQNLFDFEKELSEKIDKDCLLTINKKKTERIVFLKNSKKNMRAIDWTKLRESDSKLNANNEQQLYKKLQYLGFEFDGMNIFIRSSSLSRYYRKMKARIKKVARQTYSPKSKNNKPFRKSLLHSYTAIGKYNFISYAQNASKRYYLNSEKIRKDGMNSPSIRKQIARHNEILDEELKKQLEKMAERKLRKDKKRTKK